MAWERRGQQTYFYRSKRIGSRVVKQYVGGGRIAKFAAEVDRIEAEQKTFESALRRHRSHRYSRRLKKLRAWLTRINRITAEALIAAGWHQHKREWRRIRKNAMTPINQRVDHQTWVPSELSERAGEMDATNRKKAAAGDRSTIADVDEFLQNPSAVALWGDFGRFVLAKWVQRFAGDDLLSRRAAFRFASDLRDRLAGLSPTALELLLAERVVIAWVFANWSDLQYASKVDSTSIPLHEFHFKRIDLANRQLLAACRVLAKVKRGQTVGCDGVGEAERIVMPVPATSLRGNPS